MKIRESRWKGLTVLVVAMALGAKMVLYLCTWQSERARAFFGFTSQEGITHETIRRRIMDYTPLGVSTGVVESYLQRTGIARNGAVRVRRYIYPDEDIFILVQFNRCLLGSDWISGRVVEFDFDSHMILTNVTVASPPGYKY